MPPNKRKSHDAFANRPKVAAVFLALIASACAAGTVLAYQHATALRDDGVRTVGEIVEVHNGRSKYVVARFRDAAGAEVRADVGNYQWDPKPQVGDRPELVFDPDDPAGNVADIRSGPDFFSAWAFGFGAILAATLAIPTASGRLNWNDV